MDAQFWYIIAYAKELLIYLLQNVMEEALLKNIILMQKNEIFIISI